MGAHAAEKRPELFALIRAADCNANGELDFHEFLQFMRRCREMEDQERSKREKTIQTETGFSPIEVAEFRQIFVQEDLHLQGTLTIAQVKQFIASQIPLGNRRLEEL